MKVKNWLPCSLEICHRFCYNGNTVTIKHGVTITYGSDVAARYTKQLGVALCTKLIITTKKWLGL